MALRSFDSETRIGIVRVPPQSQRGEQFADEGTLILEPAPISVAPPSSIAPCVMPLSSRPATLMPPPPSSHSMSPRSPSMPVSIRPSMPSWDGRGWALPSGENTGSTSISALKAKSKARERSAAAMVLMATAAMLAVLVSIGLMHRAQRRADAAEAETAQTANVTPVPMNATQAPAAEGPLAAPVAPPVAQIDIDEEKPAVAPVDAPTTAPVNAPATAIAPKPAAVAAAPVANTAPAQPRAASPNVASAPAEPKQGKQKAPASAAQQKALQDLLDQLGEEQLKR